MSAPLHYLVDTNVVSEFGSKVPNAGVLRFFAATDTSALHISALTLGELRKGVAKKARSDLRASLILDFWVNGLELSYTNRILPVNASVASLWGALSAQRSRPIVDTLIASTALHYGLTLVTRNTRDVEDTGVALLNPWQES